MFAENDAVDDHPMLAGLGLEPTGNAFDGAVIADMLRGRKAPLKAALLDQRRIAGLGNIYVCEALWRARLSPRRAAGTIAGAPGRPSQRADPARRRHPRRPLPTRSQAGGSSLRDHIRTDGELGDFQHTFAVYDREGGPCPRGGCRGIIRRIVQSRPLDLLLPGLPALGGAHHRGGTPWPETILVETAGPGRPDHG